MSKKTLYIAYGSNINLGQMAYRCPTAEKVSPGFVENYELEFRRVATIVPKQDSKVPVLVWQLKPEDEKNLDRYEGFPHMYRKEIIPVKIGDKEFNGMVYIMNYGEPQPPTREYYQGIEAGYEANGMDTAPLRAAWNRAYDQYTTRIIQQSRDISESGNEEYDYDEDCDEDEDPDMNDIQSQEM